MANIDVRHVIESLSASRRAGLDFEAAARAAHGAGLISADQLAAWVNLPEMPVVIGKEHIRSIYSELPRG